MPDRRIRWALAVFAGLVLIASGAGWVASTRRPAPVVISTAGPPVSTVPAPTGLTPAPAQTPLPPAPVPSPAVPLKPVLLYVHVAGAVRHPSLYQLPPGSRVWHAVKAAGGATDKADLDALNLAQKLEDGEKVFVPTHAAEAAQTAPPSASSPAAVAFVPAPVGKAAKGTSGKPAKLTSAAQGLVDINTAGADSLERLPGIGPAMAGRIIAYRQQAGRFASPDELMQVSGIGPKKYAKIALLVKL